MNKDSMSYKIGALMVDGFIGDKDSSDRAEVLLNSLAAEEIMGDSIALGIKDKLIGYFGYDVRDEKGALEIYKYIRRILEDYEYNINFSLHNINISL